MSDNAAITTKDVTLTTCYKVATNALRTLYVNLTRLIQRTDMSFYPLSLVVVPPVWFTVVHIRV